MLEPAPTFVQDISNDNPALISRQIITADIKSENVVEEPTAETALLFDGDIVTRKLVPTELEYIPSFGSVLKQPLCANLDESPSKTFNVRWEQNNVMQPVRPEEVSVVDRFIMRNTKVENDEGVVGTVQDWNVSTTVQIIGTNYVVDKVALDRLHPISSFIRGQEILYKGWIGIINTVKRNIWFLLDGGMGFYVVATEQDGYMRPDPYWGAGTPCPGIRTKLNAAWMRKAIWVSGPMRFFSKILPPLSYLYSMAHVTLNKSEVTEVEVMWLRPSPTSPVSDPPMPETKLDREMLRNSIVVGVPSSETVGINSVRVLKLKPEDFLTTYQFWLAAFRRKFVNGVASAEPVRLPISAAASLRVLATERAYEVPVKVLSRNTTVEVAWNDGKVEKLPSVKIPKILHRKEDSEFPSGMIVAPLYSPHEVKDFYGVVLDSEDFAFSKARKVNVMWLFMGNVLETKAETVFNLRPHPIYSMYERGTVVFPRVQGTTKFKAAVVSDLHIAEGKLVVTVTADHSQHLVHPHLVAPLSRRCYWNFFTRNWNIDEIIVPPYQLETEYGPEAKYVDVVEPSPSILSNNNQDQALLIKSAWDEPVFEMLAFAPVTHRFYNCAPADKLGKQFVDVIRNEIGTLKKFGSLSEGIWVRCYENRLDLMSVLMVGPSETPYEDGIFMFDLQVNNTFPASPPKIHYVSHSYELSPNMAWDGNFCVSALNWKQESVEGGSHIAFCLKKVQALIFTPEPLLAGPKNYVDARISQKDELSKLYNEFVVLRVLDSAWNMIHRPHEPWTSLIKSHFASILPEKLAGYEHWNDSSSTQPKFPLLPASEGFHEALAHRLQKFQKISPNISSSRSQSKTQLVIDVTADSESIPVETKNKLEEVTFELVDPVPQNANDEIALALGPSSMLHSPDPESPILEKRMFPQALDSQKNIIKEKDRKKKNKKGKILTELANTTDTSSLGTESELEDVSKLIDMGSDHVETEDTDEVTTE